jgi:hypothetical protein
MSPPGISLSGMHTDLDAEPVGGALIEPKAFLTAACNGAARSGCRPMWSVDCEDQLGYHP